jgi:hypothetical protein
MAHPSGLHAYIDTNSLEQTGPIYCVGPFSSYKHRLTREAVHDYIADAIEAIESLDKYSDGFTYWGCLDQKIRPGASVVRVMDSDFGLIPNPCFRSSILIETNRTLGNTSLLAREWDQFDQYAGIEHKLGSRFHFPQDGRCKLSIIGQVEKIAEDIRKLEPQIRFSTLKMLGSLAISVLDELGADFSHSYLRKLKLRYPNNLDE